MKNIFPIIIAILLVSCSQQQARKPVSQSSGSFMKESVERNKKLVAGEEKDIQEVMNSDSSIVYIPSKKGYWYHYETQNNTNDTLHPKKGDIAYFDYEVKDLTGSVIYSEIELKPQVYRVDKENIMTGLRDGIKMMKKNEKVTFLFPSHVAYGFHGDNKQIGPNIPLIVTVTLNDFKPEETTKTE
ncbi:MAG: gliding motility-associated peptidyl-prolyl isomerase GldI [Flavobacterium sp.]|nr:gliding motility-associated peptidyl-prolyl isomerase GldI [Flavobacterium sp.]